MLHAVEPVPVVNREALAYLRANPQQATDVAGQSLIELLVADGGEHLRFKFQAIDAAMGRSIMGYFGGAGVLRFVIDSGIGNAVSFKLEHRLVVVAVSHGQQLERTAEVECRHQRRQGVGTVVEQPREADAQQARFIVATFGITAEPVEIFNHAR